MVRRFLGFERKCQRVDWIEGWIRSASLWIMGRKGIVAGVCRGGRFWVFAGGCCSFWMCGAGEWYWRFIMDGMVER